VTGAPGFVRAYWTIKDNSALSMFIFETEEAATRMSEQARSGVPGGVVLDGIEVRESWRTHDAESLGTNYELVPKPTPIGPDLA